MEERGGDMPSHPDFVQSRFEPVHLNLFLLISPCTKASRPNGLLPAKQKVGGAGLQGAVAAGRLPEKRCSTLTPRFNPLRPDAKVWREPLGLLWRKSPSARARSPL